MHNMNDIVNAQELNDTWYTCAFGFDFFLNHQIVVVFCLILPPGDFQEETLTAMALAFLAPTGTIGYGESDVRPCVTKRPKSVRFSLLRYMLMASQPTPPPKVPPHRTKGFFNSRPY